MRILLATALLMVSTAFHAQDENWRLFKSSDPVAADSVKAEKHDTITSLSSSQGAVKIIKDARIDKVTDLERGAVSIKKPGYRVQLKLSQTKEEVNTLRAQFLRIHKDHKSHIEYRQPNFILKVGDFYTRQQATEFKYELLAAFPDATVIKDDIELPKLPEKQVEVPQELPQD